MRVEYRILNIEGIWSIDGDDLHTASICEDIRRRFPHLSLTRIRIIYWSSSIPDGSALRDGGSYTAICDIVQLMVTALNDERFIVKDQAAYEYGSALMREYRRDKESTMTESDGKIKHVSRLRIFKILSKTEHGICVKLLRKSNFNWRAGPTLPALYWILWSNGSVEHLSEFDSKMGVLFTESELAKRFEERKAEYALSNWDQAAETQCVVCIERKANTYLGCADEHICVCSNCANSKTPTDEFSIASCPLCRQKIQQRKAITWTGNPSITVSS